MPTAFSSFIEVTIGDQRISFISDFSYQQTRNMGELVYTISRSTAASGGYLQQYGYIVNLTIPLDIFEENPLELGNISIIEGLQLSATLNRPGAPNDELDFTGKQLIFSGAVPAAQNGSLSEGGVYQENVTLYFTQLNSIAATGQ